MLSPDIVETNLSASVGCKPVSFATLIAKSLISSGVDKGGSETIIGAIAFTGRARTNPATNAPMKSAVRIG